VHPTGTGDSPRRRAGGCGLAALIAGVVVTLGVLSLLLGIEGFAIGLVLAALPLPIYVWLVLRLDRYEPEPRQLLVRSFLWGAGAAAFIAIILNSVGQEIVGAEFGSDVGEIYGGSVSAPVVEEVAKAAALFGVYNWRRSELDGVLDGIVYAAMVGLGFATTENVLYYGESAIDDEVPVEAVVFMRGVASPFAHPVFTAMTGIGLAFAALSPTRGRRIVAPVLGLLGAILLHSAWNTSAIEGTAFVATFFLVMIPVFVALIVVAVVARKRDGRRVAAYLAPEVASGLLRPDELNALATLGGRARALRAARSAGGRQAVRARRDLHEAATELAFHRHRIALRRADPRPRADDDEPALLTRLQTLLGRTPPAPATAPPPQPSPPPDWYADPSGRFRLRYWDGYAWTGHVTA
jgi:RsiW-degrading membrane proteinase PrsW (M82 family)